MTTLPSVALVAGLVACAHRTGQSETAQNPPPAAPDPKTVSTDEPARQGATSLDQILAGRLSGVTVTSAPGGGIVVRIEGPTSFYSSQEPLYVIDGVPVQVNKGTLTWISPHDVESITALKDAAASIYGLRGANGVIVIKTKGSH